MICNDACLKCAIAVFAVHGCLRHCVSERSKCMPPAAERTTRNAAVYLHARAWISHACTQFSLQLYVICEAWRHILRQFGRTKDDFLIEANRSIEEHEEGLILKLPASPYKPGSFEHCVLQGCIRQFWSSHASNIASLQMVARESLC